jgi:hypothetical protein
VVPQKKKKKKRTNQLRSRWEDGIRMDLRENGLGIWTGFDWLRIGAGGELL